MKKSLLLLLLFTLAFSNAFSQWSQLNRGFWCGAPGGVVIRDSTIIGFSSLALTISTDLGKTWKNCDHRPEFGVEKVTMNEKGIYAKSESCVFFSSDFANSWSKIYPPGKIPANFVVTDKYIFYITQNSSSHLDFFRSGDNGSSWQKLKFDSYYNQLWDVFSDGKNLFAMSDGLYMSTDNGDSWELIHQGWSESHIRSIYKDGNDIFMGTVSGLLHSTDNGSTWQKSNNGMSDTLIQCLAHSDNNIFAGALFGNLYKSTDNGYSWQIINNNSSKGWIQYIAIKDSMIILSNGTISYDNGNTWSTITHGCHYDRPFATAVLVNNGDIYAGLYDGGIYYSSDGGSTWSLASNGLGNLHINTLVALDNCIFAGTNEGIYVSKDKGCNWNLTGINDVHINTLATYDSALYAGTDKDGLFVSYNKGQTWSPLGSMNDVRAVAKWGDKLFAGTYGDGVFLSTDMGSTWTDASIGLTNSYVMSLDANGSTTYAGTMSGIFASTDDGNSWKLVCSNGGTLAIKIVSPYIFTVAVDGVFISTNNGGSWKTYNKGVEYVWSNNKYLFVDNQDLYLATSDWIFKTNAMKLIYSDVNEGSAEKEEFNISPSVSSGSFNFSFDRAAGEGSLLTISDPTGRVIKSVELLPDQKDIQLDLSELSPGVYFSTFFNGRFNSTRKLIVVK